MTLATIISKHGARKPSWLVRAYERELASLPAPKHMLEIGVQRGFSCKAWREFYPGTVYHGIDRGLPDNGTPYDFFYKGDQGDANFMAETESMLPPVSLIIDDASHQYAHQIDTFRLLWNRLVPGGLYVCEDTSTSYSPRYGQFVRGMSSKGQTAIDFFRRLVDVLHFRWYADPDLSPHFGYKRPQSHVLDSFELRVAGEIESINFHQGAVFIRKLEVEDASNVSDDDLKIVKGF